MAESTTTRKRKAKTGGDYIEVCVASTETRLIQCLKDLFPSTWSTGRGAPMYLKVGSDEAKDFLEKKFDSLQLSESRMDVGDIGLTYYESADDKTGKLIFLVERKSKADLYASFKDQRYKEQSLRLRMHPDLGSPRQVIYLLEVAPGENAGMNLCDRVEWFRTETSLMCKPGHDFLVLRTNGTEDTALALLSFASKTLDTIRSARKQEGTYPDQELPYYLGASTLGYTSLSPDVVRDKVAENMVLQMKKQGNLTPQMYYISVLGGIPNVGAEMAKAISNKYSCFQELFEVASKEPDKFVQEVQVIKYGSTNRQSSIGEGRARNILRFLCGAPEEGTASAPTKRFRRNGGSNSNTTTINSDL